MWPLLKPARMESAAGADMLKPVCTVAPTAYPVSVTEAMEHCRIDTTDENALLQALIEAAVAHVDGYSGILGRALMTQTWQQSYPGFTAWLSLPVGNLISINTITYYDSDNVQQTLSSTIYRGLNDSVGPYVAEKPDQSWPSAYTREDAVTVTWTAGYGATPASVPAAIRRALLLIVGHLYENREPVVIGAPVATLPMAVDALLAPYRLRRY